MSVCAVHSCRGVGVENLVSDISTMVFRSREIRNSGKTVGLVPTMGALHEGHLSLVDIARQRSDFVVVSVYVNPTQFCPGEDFNTYPRNLEDDIYKINARGGDVVFAPDTGSVYPEGYSTFVIVEGLTDNLCGRSRPHHFRGVTTVVAKLFNIVRPHIAVFGQKDAQQLAVIRKMVKDLNYDIEIVAAPIVREKDGLAMSSRNAYLSGEERTQAPVLYQSLLEAKELVLKGEIDAASIKNRVMYVLESAPLAIVEYVEIVEPDTIRPVDTIEDGGLLAIAVRFGKTRLIDNLIIKAG